MKDYYNSEAMNTQTEKMEEMKELKMKNGLVKLVKSLSQGCIKSVSGLYQGGIKSVFGRSQGRANSLPTPYQLPTKAVSTPYQGRVNSLLSYNFFRRVAATFALVVMMTMENVCWGQSNVWVETTTITPNTEYLIGFVVGSNVYLAVNYAVNESNHYYTSVSSNYYGYTAKANFTNGNITGVEGYATDLQYCTWKFSTASGGTITSGYESGRYLYGYTSSSYADLYPNTSSQVWTYNSVGQTLYNGNYYADYKIVNSAPHMAVSSSHTYAVKLYTKQAGSTPTGSTCETVGTGTSTTNRLPFDNYYNYSWNQMIFTAQEIGLTNGCKITKISFQGGSGNYYETASDLKIYMGKRSTAQHSSTTDWAAAGSLTEVYAHTNVSLGTATAGSWQEFILDNPYTYDGADNENLVVVVAKKGSWNTSVKWRYTSVSSSCLYRGDDNNVSYASHPGSSSGTSSYYRPNTEFCFSCSDPNCTTPTITFGTPSTGTLGSSYTKPTLSCNSSGAKTWSSSNTDVATVDGSGNITLKSCGETTITVNVAVDATYCSGSASYTLTVNGSIPTISGCSGGDLVIPNTRALSVTGGGTTTWSSSSGAASVSPTTGSSTTVTAVSVGMATITANVAANPSGGYCQATPTCQITVVCAPPANSTCATATTLSCGASLNGTTVCTPGDAHGIPGAEISRYGVWYKFVGDGQVTTISSTSASGYDHQMDIIKGSCDNLTLIAERDGAASGGTETYTFLTESGVTYYVYIAYYGSGGTSSNTGTFTISRTCFSNPLTSATTLPCGTSNQNGTTVGTPGNAHGIGYDISNYGVWYTFVGDGNVSTVSTTTTTFNHEMIIATGTYGNFTIVADQDAVYGAGTESYAFLAENGVTYYVYVAYYTSGNTTGAFTISRSCTPPPTNTTCADAISLPCGTTDLAGTTAGTPGTAHGTGYDLSNYGVWYTFTGDGNITTVSSTASSGFNHAMVIVSGSCGDFTQVTFRDASYAGETETYTFATEIGVNYYVYVASNSSYGTTTGNFTISRICVDFDCPKECTISYKFHDSDGDGWNGNAIRVVDAATGMTLAEWTIESGSDETGTLSVCEGRELQFYWISGSYISEVSYSVMGPNDEIVSGDGDGFSSPLSYTPDCSCPRPSNITVSAITESSALVRWTENGSATSWVLEYSTSSNFTGATTVNVSTNPNTTLTGLTSGTTYYVRVKSNCDGGAQSNWSIPTNFITITCPLPCLISYELEDSYGDGWNGAYIEVVDVTAGNATIANWTVSSGYSASGTLDVQARDGHELQFVWHSGNYDGECSYTVKGPDGNNIFSGSYAMGSAVSYTPNCSCSAPTDLTVYDIISNAASVTWGGCPASSYNIRYAIVDTYYEGFENGIPATWTTIDADGDGNNWLALSEIPTTYPYYAGVDFSNWAHSGADAAASPSYENGSGGFNSNHWLISPQITLGGSLKFYATSENGDQDSYEVLLSTTGTAPANFTITLQSMRTASYGSWDEVNINLSGYSGQGYIAIHHVSSSMYFLVIDDFEVNHPIGSWTTTTTTTNNIDLSGLEPDTTYEVQVQADCGGGDVSNWTTDTFTTLPCNIDASIDISNP